MFTVKRVLLWGRLIKYVRFFWELKEQNFYKQVKMSVNYPEAKKARDKEIK